jgi:hypothetical protein
MIFSKDNYWITLVAVYEVAKTLTDYDNKYLVPYLSDVDKALYSSTETLSTTVENILRRVVYERRSTGRDFMDLDESITKYWGSRTLIYMSVSDEIYVQRVNYVMNWAYSTGVRDYASCILKYFDFG